MNNYLVMGFMSVFLVNCSSLGNRQIANESKLRSEQFVGYYQTTDPSLAPLNRLNLRTSIRVIMPRESYLSEFSRINDSVVIVEKDQGRSSHSTVYLRCRGFEFSLLSKMAKSESKNLAKYLTTIYKKKNSRKATRSESGAENASCEKLAEFTRKDFIRVAEINNSGPEQNNLEALVVQADEKLSKIEMEESYFAVVKELYNSGILWPLTKAAYKTWRENRAEWRKEQAALTDQMVPIQFSISSQVGNLQTRISSTRDGVSYLEPIIVNKDGEEYEDDWTMDSLIKNIAMFKKNLNAYKKKKPNLFK